MNHQFVEDAAAFLFWKLSEVIGVQDANTSVCETAGQCLLIQPFTESVLIGYGSQKWSSDDRRLVFAAIAEEAETHARSERNLIGTIYTEDDSFGRSPSAVDVDTSSIKFIPSSVRYSRPIEKVGRLCLRHPLPAIVFSDVEPANNTLIEVADTTAALGFQTPIFLKAFQCQNVNGLFLLTGVFSIPAPNNSIADLWGRVIQNSSRFFERLEVVHEVDSGVLNSRVEVFWP